MSEIILIGFMGSGKTTVGKILAAKLNKPLIDLDAAIIQQRQQSIAEIFNQDGEPAFRKIESDVLKTEIIHPGVLATGGGTPITIANQSILQTCQQPIVLLETEWQSISNRLSDDGRRPLFSHHHARELFWQRHAIYEQVATHHVRTDHQHPEMIADQILNLVAPSLAKQTARMN